MGNTLLPKKANKIPVATDDDHYDAMAADPTIPEIPQGTSFGQAPAINQSPAYQGMPMQNYTQVQQPVIPPSDVSNELKHSKESAEWFNKRWRPAMGWMYMMVCIFDFVLFPIMFTVVQFWETEAMNDAFRQWQPLTLQGAGLFHMAMGAVLGITAWSRGQEKIAGKS